MWVEIDDTIVSAKMGDTVTVKEIFTAKSIGPVIFDNKQTVLTHSVFFFLVCFLNTSTTLTVS